MSFAGAIRAGRAFIELSVRDGLARPLARAQARLRAFSAAMAGTGARLVGFSAAVSVPVVSALKVFTSFSDTMLTLKSLIGGGLNFDTLRQKAKDLGATTSFTAAQVGEAMIALRRGGFNANEIMDSVLHTLNLARAGGLELGDAATIVVKSLRGLHLSTEETGRVVNVLVEAANSGATTIADFGEALKFVIGSAKNTGQSVETVASALSILANNALVGTIAGTSLNQMLLKLGTDGRKKLENLKIDVVDEATGKFRNLADIMQDVGAHAQSLPEADRLAFFKEIFDVRGGRAAVALAGMNKEFQELFGRLNNVGDVAGDVAKTMDSGLGGAMRRLLSVIQDVAISIGEALEGPLLRAASAGQKLAQRISRIIQNNQGLVRGLLFAAVAIGAVGVGLIAAGFAFSGLSSVMGVALAIVGLFKASLLLLLTPLGLAATAIAAVVIWSGAGSEALDFLAKSFSDLKAMAMPAIEGIKNALLSGDLKLAGQILWKTLEILWVGGTNKLLNVWTEFKFGLLKAFDEAMTGITIMVNGMIKGIAGPLQSLLKTAGLGAIADKIGALVTAADIGTQITADALGSRKQGLDLLAQQEIDARASSLEKLNAELAELNEQAEAGRFREEGSLTQDLIDAALREAEKLQPAEAESLRKAEAAKGLLTGDATTGIQGSFSAAAISRFGLGTSPAKKMAADIGSIAESSERTAVNTEEWGTFS